VNAEPRQPARPFDTEEVYRAYLAGLLTNDRARCRALFEQWLEADPDLRSLYENLVRRSLYEVGELWEQGKISVATEHLATAISESLLNLTYHRLFARPRAGKSAVVTCVANEYHQIGGKMVADVFELHGWRGYFLGANTPVRDLLGLVGEKRPDVVALSVASVFGLEALVRAAQEIRAAFPTLPMLVGGQALRWGVRDQLAVLPGVSCLQSLGELESWIKEAAPHG
jgi:methanogenic corrinoid protein MtbC1